MNIVVNTRGRLAGSALASLRHLFSVLIKNFPGHQFIFITDEAIPPLFPVTENVIQFNEGKRLNHPVLLTWWHLYKLPGILKKFKADILVNANGMGCTSAGVPQLLMLDDEAILPLKHHKKHAPVIFSRKKRIRNNLVAAIQKAYKIIVPSDYSKKELTRLFNIEPNNIMVTGMPPGVEYSPVNIDEKELIKKEYTRGREYFLYTGPIQPGQGIITILKAFSIFKKRQLSNMQLVLAGNINWPGNSFKEKLGSYKFREEVILLSPAPEDLRAKLTAGAYAFISASATPGFSIPILSALRCGVPVIEILLAAEPGNEVALRALSDDPLAVANHMKLLYKDENLRSQLIEKGRLITEKYQEGEIAAIIWNAIAQSIKLH